jgi:hypothetical protein
MDFPLFHLDFFGNRMLVAVIAITHVFISHLLAVGAMPLITLLEHRAHRDGDAAKDRLAYRVLGVAFVITTSFGALTGVGIWFSTALVNPEAIGSLIRVFFLAWFAEWIVFVIEVVAIMIYFLTWKRMSGRHKGRHVAIGAVLSVFSWLTMAIIVGILAFMMDPGSWSKTESFVSAFFNPVYLPQLLFRTPFAMIGAGMFALFTLFFVARREDAARPDAIRVIAGWSLAWLPLMVVGALWYRAVIPGWMLDNVPVALATQAFATWHDTLLELLLIAAALVVFVSLWGLLTPRRLPRVAMLVPLVAAFLLIGYFERVREFIRKPYVIHEYMYANGLRVKDYPLFRQEGLLAHATYVSTRTIDDENRLQAGRDVFRIACTRCHTTAGVNSIVSKLEDLYGPGRWDEATVRSLIGNIHNTRPYMPPFPGTNEELAAMTDYIFSLREFPRELPGAQSAGVEIPASGTSGSGGR